MSREESAMRMPLITVLTAACAHAHADASSVAKVDHGIAGHTLDAHKRGSRFMNRIAFAAVLAVAAHVAAALADPQPIKGYAEWRVSLDAQGHVTKLESNDRLLDFVHARLDPLVRSWPFIPGALDGTPSPTETNLMVGFTLVPHGTDDYTVRIDSARTGGAFERRSQTPPQYPKTEMHLGKSGFAVLDVKYATDGHVTEVRRADGAPDVAEDFFKASREAVFHWKFEPEIVGGIARAGHVVTPMCFQVVRTSGLPKAPPPSPPACHWTPPGERVALQDGDTLPIDPAARLRDDVTTHAP
jgi:TonB family protein